MRRKTGVLVGMVLAVSGMAHAFTIDDFDTVTDPSQAALYCFDLVGSGNSSAADLAELDFGLAVTTSGSKLFFEFINESDISSVITLIYFDDSGSSLIGNGTVVSTQVNNVLKFNIGGGSPSNMPGGNGIGFTANTALTAHASNPKPKNGVGAGEKLVLSYDYLTATPADVIAALNNGTLRVGFHVQSIGTAGESDAFVSKPFTTPPPPLDPIPEPSTLVLLGMGSSFLFTRLRRQV